MNKQLLFIGIATLASAMTATAENRVVPEAFITSVSPNGKYAVSQVYGTVILINIETGEQKFFYGDDYNYNYSAGNGNAISNDGVVAGTTTNEDAAYLKDGEWHQLNVPNPDYTNTANGITPDGKMICGSVGNGNPYAGESNAIMQLPAVWELGADGTYGDPVMLPHPTLDFSGRVPMYITANAISADGNTITGQVQDYSGFFNQPIVYRRDAAGKWSYELVQPQLLNPDGLKFPEYPGEAPEMPQAEDFLGDQHLIDYREAMTKWEEETPDDWENYPTADKFLDEEEKAAYDAAMAEYQKKYDEWDAKFMAFMDVFEKCQDEGVMFQFNNVSMTTAGTKAVMAGTYTVENPDPNSWMRFIEIPSTYIFDYTNNTYKKVDDGKEIIPVYLAASGTVLGYNQSTGYRTAYILPEGSDEYMTLTDYLKPRFPQTCDWLIENTTHKTEMYDWETESFYEVEVVCTGMPTASEDLSVISTTTEQFWEDTPTIAYSYVMTLTPEAGIADSAADTLVIGAEKGAVITIAGNASALEVYGLDGRAVYSASNPGARVATGLPAGVYVVKATDAEGAVKVAKVAF